MNVDRRVRILHLITDLHIGGAENMVAKLVGAMDRERFENIVVSMTDGGALWPVIEQADVKVRSLNMRRGVPNPIAVLRLQRLLRTERPDILQTWLYHADLLGLLTRGRARIPRLAWNLRGSHLELSKFSALLVRALARLSHLPDVVIFNSQAGRRVHERMGYRPRRWEFIPNGVDLEEFRPNAEARTRLRADLGLCANALLIGLVARYDRMKDHANFLNAAGILAKTCTDASFALVGRGIDDTNDKLRVAIAANGLEGCVFLLGERRDVPEITAALDIATSSSSGEGFPNAVGEAMACGIPCVVTDVGDSRLIVDDTGRVVPAKDSRGLAAAWRDLIEIGAESRANLGSAARRRIRKHYNLSAIIRRYEDLYEELTEDAQPHQRVRSCAANQHQETQG